MQPGQMLPERAPELLRQALPLHLQVPHEVHTQFPCLVPADSLQLQQAVQLDDALPLSLGEGG